LGAVDVVVPEHISKRLKCDPSEINPI
jgi:hypothetical protein